MTPVHSRTGLSGRTTIPNSIPSLPRRQPMDAAPASWQYDDDQDDNFPLLPHLAESSKRRAASDSRRPVRKVHVQYDRNNSISSSRL